MKKHTSLVTTGSPESPGVPTRNGFNGLLRALPGDRALLPPSLRRETPAKLDASIGASGPHDFAVRVSIIRPRTNVRLTLPRPPHPAPNVRDDRETPLCVGRDGGGYSGDLGLTGTGMFFRSGLDRANQLDPVEESSFLAQGAQGIAAVAHAGW
jgi:hypothetical protein